MKLNPLIFAFFTGFSGLTQAGSPPKWQESPMPYDWGMQRMEVGHTPFRMPVLKDSNLSRKKRLYWRNRMTVNRQGLVIGHQASSVEGAEEYLKLSGAGKESARVQTIRMNKEGWKKGEEFEDPAELSLFFTQIGLDLFMHNNPQIKVPLPPTPQELIFPNLHDELGPIVKEDMRRAVLRPADHYNRKQIHANIQHELTKGLGRPARDFNKRMAEALGLKDPADVDCGSRLSLPPPPSQLDLADLGPDEDWREFLPDYRISRRRGYWYVGEAQYYSGDIGAWLTKMGYDQAGHFINGNGTPNNALMQLLDEVNARLAADLEARARALNPSLSSQLDKPPVAPLGNPSPVPRLLSPREMPDQ